MHSLFGFMWVIQLGLLFHVFKTGRPYWWFAVLLIAPLVGALAYVLIELIPAFSTPAGISPSWKPRSWRIRDLREQLAETDTVKLRLTLASELLASQDPVAARTLAEECLQGVWRDDPHTLAAVARYRLEAGDIPGALEALDRVKIQADRMLGTEVTLLRGRALVLAGRHLEAQPLLRPLVGTYLGEEPRYYLALSLRESGEAKEAEELWNDLRRRYRQANPGWRRGEKRWFKLAGERLAEMKKAYRPS